MTPKEAMDEAVRRAGSGNQLAQLLGISRQAVDQWPDHIPVLRVLAVEAATGVSRHDQRPDIYPIEEPRAMAAG